MSEPIPKGFTIGEDGDRHELTVMVFQNDLVVDTAFMTDGSPVRVWVKRKEGRFEVFIHRDEQEVAQVLLPDNLEKPASILLEEGLPAAQTIAINPVPLMILEGEVA